VRDDQVLRSRVQPELQQVFAPGAEIKTSHEFVRQMRGELQGDRTHQTTGEQMEKAKESTQVQEMKQTKEKDPLAFLDEAHGLGKDKDPEKEVAIAPAAERPRRARAMDMDFGR